MKTIVRSFAGAYLLLFMRLFMCFMEGPFSDLPEINKRCCKWFITSLSINNARHNYY